MTDLEIAQNLILQAQSDETEARTLIARARTLREAADRLTIPNSNPDKICRESAAESDGSSPTASTASLSSPVAIMRRSVSNQVSAAIDHSRKQRTSSQKRSTSQRGSGSPTNAERSTHKMSRPKRSMSS